jgi:hypothetical protein
MRMTRKVKGKNDRELFVGFDDPKKSIFGIVRKKSVLPSMAGE